MQKDIIVNGVHFNPEVWNGLTDKQFAAKAKALDVPDEIAKELREATKSLVAGTF